MSDPEDTRGRDPEVVLSQALRAIAGGGRRLDGGAGGAAAAGATGAGAGTAGAAGGAGAAGAPVAVGPSWWSRLTSIQIVLLALILGVSAGMIAGIGVLLTR